MVAKSDFLSVYVAEEKQSSLWIIAMVSKRKG